MGLPQIIWIILAGISIGGTAMKHGENQPPYNIWLTLMGTLLSFGLLLWGGFFK